MKGRMKVSVGWNAGRSEYGGKAVDNVLFGASWSHWVLTIVTPSKGGKIRRDLKKAA